MTDQDNHGMMTRARSLAAKQTKVVSEGADARVNYDQRRTSFSGESEHWQDASEAFPQLIQESPPTIVSHSPSPATTLPPSTPHRASLQAQIDALRAKPPSREEQLRTDLEACQQKAIALERDKHALLVMLAEKDDAIANLERNLRLLQLEVNRPILASQGKPPKPQVQIPISFHADTPSARPDSDDDQHYPDQYPDPVYEDVRPWRNNGQRGPIHRRNRHYSDNYHQHAQGPHNNSWDHRPRSAFQKINEKDLPTFDDQTELITAWFSKIDVKRELYSLSDRDIIQALPTMFQGTAKEWLLGVIKPLLRTFGHDWNKWKQALLDQFYDHEKMHRLRTEFRTLNYQKFNSFSTFIKKKYSLRSLIYGEDIPDSESDAKLIEDVLQFFSPLSVGMFKTIYLQK